MLRGIVLLLAAGTLAAIALRRLMESEDPSALERETAKQLDALREHLFDR